MKVFIKWTGDFDTRAFLEEGAEKVDIAANGVYLCDEKNAGALTRYDRRFVVVDEPGDTKKPKGKGKDKKQEVTQ